MLSPLNPPKNLRPGLDYDNLHELIALPGPEIPDTPPHSFPLSSPDYRSYGPMLRSVAAGSVRASPRAVKADISAIAQGLITPAATKQFAGAARDAFADLENEARQQGVCIHPVAAAVRISDTSGNVLFTSDPVVLARPEGKETDGRIIYEAHATAGYAVAGEIEAPAWRPELIMPSELIEALPAGVVVEIMMSQPLGSFSAAAMPTVSPRRRAGDPLVSVTLEPSRPDLMRIVADDAFATVFSTRRPLSSETPAAVPPTSVKARTGAECYPEVIGAGSAASSSTAVVWGAPALRRPRPSRADRYAVAAAGAKAWHAYTAVEFADGSVQVTASDGESDAPTLLSPLLCYPSPDATAITLTVSDGTEVRTGRFPLIPAGNKSVYVHPALNPFALPDTAALFIVPEEKPAVDERPSCVAIASSSNPSAPFAIVAPDKGSVTAVARDVGSQSAWDYGRSSFYVFTTEGIYLLSADPARRTASVALIDNRTVGSPRAVCRVDGALAAIASGDIILLAGTRINRIGRIPRANALAWHHDTHELWCLTDDSVEAICFDAGNFRYSRCPAHASGGIPVRYEERFSIPRGKKYLFADCPGEYENLTVTVARCNGLELPPEPDVSVEVSGRLAAPLVIPLLLPPTAREATVTVEGVAAPGAKVRAIRINSL